MKKKELFKLKNQLYPTFDLLKQEPDLDIELIQFFDEKPSIKFWEINISANEENIIYFKNDLEIKERFLNYESTETALKDLNEYIGHTNMFQLFINQSNSIFFDRSNFNPIIKSIYFFEESYLLYCYDDKKIITGGFSGFTLWKKTN